MERTQGLGNVFESRAAGSDREAMEVLGGRSYYRMNLLERLFRDVHAAQFHPLSRWDQYVFTGSRLADAAM